MKVIDPFAKKTIDEEIKENEDLPIYEAIPNKKEEPVPQKKEQINDFLDNYQPKNNISGGQMSKTDFNPRNNSPSHPSPPSKKKSFSIDDKKIEDKKEDTKKLIKPISKKEEKKIRKEKKKFESQSDEVKDVVVEKRGTDWTRALIYLSAFGIVAVVMMTQIANEMNPAFVLLIWLFGMMAFLPLGLIVGWLFFDPYMRCKVLRRMRGKNYGVCNFIERGGQKIVTRIKNLDDDCVVMGTKLWFMDKEGIHYLDKDNNKVFHCEIEPEDIKTLPANVPCIFLDVETMRPISFGKELTQTDPQHAGAIILGYINNQIAKNKAFRQSTTILMIVVIGMLLVNIVLTFQVYQWVDEMQGIMSTLKNQIQQLGELLSNINIP